MPLLMVTTSFSMKIWNSFIVLTVLASIKDRKLDVINQIFTVQNPRKWSPFE